MNADNPIARELFAEIWRGLGGDEVWLDRVRFHGDGALPSPFAVTDFAAATFAAAGSAVAELLEAAGAAPSVIDVDRVMSSAWFHRSGLPARVLRMDRERRLLTRSGRGSAADVHGWDGGRGSDKRTRLYGHSQLRDRLSVPDLLFARSVHRAHRRRGNYAEQQSN